MDNRAHSTFLPVVVFAGMAFAATGVLMLLADILPPWWFRTDYCPQDPELYCGGTAPIMFTFLGVGIGLVVVLNVVQRWRGDN
jgi:hypothetical protein